MFILPLVLFLYFLYHNFVVKVRDFPAGPTPLPIIGNLHQLDAKSPDKTVAIWGKKFGGIFTFWMGGAQPIVAVTDYGLIKEALVKNGEVYSGRPTNWLFESLGGGGRYGLISTDGKQLIVSNLER